MITMCCAAERDGAVRDEAPCPAPNRRSFTELRSEPFSRILINPGAQEVGLLRALLPAGLRPGLLVLTWWWRVPVRAVPEGESLTAGPAGQDR
ncbi:hypothetical protein GCM10009665_45250 [Kitasatospora nipponensis]|uniref:Uncharacterized protein n=1 Tax=Kitasatospora nipponensis TaxID=258049 RepID=A0ABP4H3Z9_9ACTN